MSEPQNGYDPMKTITPTELRGTDRPTIDVPPLPTADELMKKAPEPMNDYGDVYKMNGQTRNTTIAGIIVLVCGIARTLFPDYAFIADAVLTLAAGFGLIAAVDATKKPS